MPTLEQRIEKLEATVRPPALQVSPPVRFSVDGRQWTRQQFSDMTIEMPYDGIHESPIDSLVRMHLDEQPKPEDLGPGASAFWDLMVKLETLF